MQQINLISEVEALNIDNELRDQVADLQLQVSKSEVTGMIN